MTSRHVFTFPTDSLHYLKNVEIDDSTIHKFLSHAKMWPVDKSSLWMGSFTLSFENAAKETRQLVVSSYGGFFYDPLNKRYYELPDMERDDWYVFLNAVAEKLENDAKK